MSSSASSAPIQPADLRFTATERRASASLASIYALRMLGLFLVLPIFAIEAQKYPGGDDPALVGLCMGIYGLTQGLLQIPFGMASDRLGRKPVILFGLFIFGLGSVLAAWAPTLDWLIVGRAVQGAGAVSAAVSALLADLTRDQVRTKAMAIVGMSIGLMFALSLVLSPLLNAWVGLSGLFVLTALLTLAGMAVVQWVTPNIEASARPVTADDSPPMPTPNAWANLQVVLRTPELVRLNVGVFVLHAVQLAMWVAIPLWLVQAGLLKADHWKVYLPCVLLSFVVMAKWALKAEAQGRLRQVFLGSIALIGLVQCALWLMGVWQLQSLWLLALCLLVFFVGFNVLEATMPSRVSKLATGAMRGTALGVYNSLQSLGFFVGGAAGGYLMGTWGAQVLFATCGLAVSIWLVTAWGMRR